MDIGKLAKDEVVVEVPWIDGVTVSVKYLTRDVLLDILKKTTKTIFDPKTHQATERADHAKANQMIGAAAIQGWSGITQDGEEFPFTPENRDLLMLKWGEFSRFVNEVSTDLSRLMDAEREAARKKS